jgi:hypothetical protein
MMAIAVGSPLRRGSTATHSNERSDERSRVVRFTVATVALVSFGFFIYSAIRQRVEPNWPSVAYIPAIVLIATATWSRRGEKWLKAGVILAGVMSVVIYAQALAPILPIAPNKDPIARAFGWNDLAAAAQRAAMTAMADSARSTTWLGGDRYQEASEIAFHAPSHPKTFATNLSGRMNQYDLWPGFPQVAHAGDNLVLVLDDSDELHATIRALAPFFAAARRGERVVLRRGSGEIGVRRVWVLSSWRGGWPSRSEP